MPPSVQLVYEAGSLEIDTGRRELRARGVPVPISGRAFEIVEVLARSAGELVTKDALMTSVWPGGNVSEGTLHVHISAIRKALGPDRAMLRTTTGRGYRLVGRCTIREKDASPDAPASSLGMLGPRRSTNLPHAAFDLIGRATAVRELRDLLSAYCIVTLTGPGGIGKTVLALECGPLPCAVLRGRYLVG